MINIKVTMPDNDAIQKSIIDIIKKEINSKLKDVSCPIHHQRPTVVVSGNINNPKYEIKGCCQVLIDEAKKVLS
jgi:hypothetical protein